MAETVQETIRLDVELTGILPTNTYEVLQEGYQRLYMPAVTVERSLTGNLQVHRVMSGSDPLVFDNRQYILLLTPAQLTQIKADLGRNVYFMPHERDETDVSYRRIVHFKSLVDVQPVDIASLTYWRATIHLEQGDGLTV